MKAALKKIAEPELAAKARWVISTQLIISIITALFFLMKGSWEAVAAFYGGITSLCITMLLLWGIKRASDAAKDNPGKSMRILYVGAAQRFLLVLGFAGTGYRGFQTKSHRGVCRLCVDTVELPGGFAV